MGSSKALLPLLCGYLFASTACALVLTPSEVRNAAGPDTAALSGGTGPAKGSASLLLRRSSNAAQLETGLEPLRGGGMGKKLGPKNLGLLVILCSLFYLPRAMSFCNARYDPRRGQVQRLGCGSGLTITNIMTLSGLGLVLANSRQYDRHGRSKLKMRLTGGIIMCLGMFLIIAHAELAKVSWYSSSNAYLGLILEWWGFVSLFYNFTPRFVAQVPRELSKMWRKMASKAGLASPDSQFRADQDARQKEIDRLNRWAQSNTST